MKFETVVGDEWNNGIKNASCTKEFGEANKSEGEIYYTSEEKNKALVIIKKKYTKIFSRAQIFTDSLDIKFLEKIIQELIEKRIPFARIGNTIFGIEQEIKLKNSKLIKRNTFILDLEKTEKEIWSNFNKKLRNAIRKAEKEGVKISEIKNEQEMRNYYSLSLKTQKNIQKNKGRKTFSIQNYNFFKELWENKLGRFFIAKFGEEIIAGALFLVWNNKSIYFHSCSDRGYKNRQAPSLIQWKAIKKFKSDGIKEYDLGGVTIDLDESDSRFFVYEFKRKFNGELKGFYNVEIELNRFKSLQDFLIRRVYGK